MADYLDEQTKQLQELYNKQQAQELANAQAGRDNELNGLDRQLNSGLPSFVTQRNQADYSNALDTQKSREMMASMGAFNSGDNVNLQGRLFTNKQNAMNQINTDENKFRTDITNKKNDVSSNYLLSESNIKNAIASQLAQALQQLNEQERARIFQAQEAEKQRQWQAEQEKLSYERQQASSSSSSSGSSGGTNSSNPSNNVLNSFQQAMQGGPQSGGAFLRDNKANIIDATSQSYYNQLSDIVYQAQLAKNKSDQDKRTNKYQVN